MTGSGTPTATLTEGDLLAVGTVVTHDGVDAALFDAFGGLSPVEGLPTEIGVYVDGDVLYLVSENESGYFVKFGLPFFRVPE